MKKNKAINIDLNKDYKIFHKLKAGDYCSLNGKMFVLRDAAHQRIKDMLESGRKIKVSFENSVIYYMGPTPAHPGNVIGSCGPTSSYRMDSYLETILKLGTIATIGKGERTPQAAELIIKYKAPYLITIGGAGAYLTGCVTSSKIIMFEELGPEAVIEITVKNFPVIVGIDIRGKNIF